MMEESKKIIPYGRQAIDQSDINAVIEIMRSPFLTQGPTVDLFEKAICDKVHANYSVAVNSATSALHIACLALGLSEGDWLWTSPITFVASANCARYCRAKVDFVDIDDETGLIDIKVLSSKLEQAEKKGCLPKVVVPVHLAGSSCDMVSIHKLAKRFGFKVLEDASHAIGGKYKGDSVGNCKYSDITVFSFHPVKIITTGEGGLATTNCPILEERMRDLRSHGVVKDFSRLLNKNSGPWVYEQQQLGYNYRMSDMHAALGLSQLKKLDIIVKERNRQFLFYSELLENTTVKLLKIPKEVVSSLHLAVIRIPGISATIHREIFESLRTKGIGVQVHYTPVHLQPYYQNLGFLQGNLPMAEKYAETCMSIPIFPGLSESEQNFVVNCLKEVIQ